MPTEKLSMRKIKEVLRLHYEQSLGVKQRRKLTPCQRPKLTPLCRLNQTLFD